MGSIDYRNNTEKEELNSLRALSRLLDSRFEGPFGIKFGLDAIVGLIPFVGDFATTGLSLYIIFQAARLQCTPSTLMRMALNVLIDNVIDLIPLIGNFFDFWWKSNNRNMALLEAHLQRPGRVRIESRMILALITFSFLGFLALSGYLTYLAVTGLYHFFQTI